MTGATIEENMFKTTYRKFADLTVALTITTVVTKALPAMELAIQRKRKMNPEMMKMTTTQTQTHVLTARGILENLIISSCSQQSRRQCGVPNANRKLRMGYCNGAISCCLVILFTTQITM